MTNSSPVGYPVDVNNNIAKNNKSSLIPVLIITALAIGLYLNTLKNGFVYDDDYTIVKNTLIKRFDNLPLLFDKIAYFNRSGEISYRPVVTFTYFIDYALYGLKPRGYHLTNVLLHAINGVLLYIFLSLLLNKSVYERHETEDRILHTPYPASYVPRLTSPAFLISLIFVTHPVLTEAVNCISYREDLLTFLFYMATLSLYLILRKPTTGPRPLTTAFLYLLSCLTFLLALLSKEMALTLPLIVFCYEWLYGKEKSNLHSRLFNRYSIGYLTIILFYLYLRFYLFHNPEEQIRAWSLVERFLTLPWLILTYLRRSLFPVNLSADYVINPVSSPFSPIFILPVIALVSIYTIILLHPPLDPLPSTEGKQAVPSPLAGEGQGEGALRQRSALFGALFFLITLIPVYNIVPTVNPFAERYLYLPVAGFVVLAVLFAYLIAEKLKAISEFGNRYVPVFFLLVSIIFSFSVVSRNTLWRDEYSLWSDTVAKMPNSSRAYNNLGLAYQDQNRLDEAIQAYLTSLRLRPDYAEVYHNLGLVYRDQGRLDEAIQVYLTALRQRPELAEAYNNLGSVYHEQGRFDAAIKAYKTAVSLRPELAAAYYNLGLAYLRQGRYDEAIYEFTIALKLKPDDKEAYDYRESAYRKKKGYSDAGIATSLQNN